MTIDVSEIVQILMTILFLRNIILIISFLRVFRYASNFSTLAHAWIKHVSHAKLEENSNKLLITKK